MTDPSIALARDYTVHVAHIDATGRPVLIAGAPTTIAIRAATASQASVLAEHRLTADGWRVQITGVVRHEGTTSHIDHGATA